jgi:trans-2,3-dihydro-3-hydroxyanthranilate isomerase
MTEFHIVDVFARERYAGNQLAVIESDGDLSAEEMQAIAAEMDFSETTFVESRESPYRVRIFTPKAEIPFAGHPTLGTAAVIREHVAEGSPDEIVLDLDVGEVPVEVEGGDGEEILWMTQQPPEFGEGLAHERLAAVLGLDESALDEDWPVQIVSTGLPTIVVPLESRDALTSIDVDRAAYDDVTGDLEAKNVLAFCTDARSVDNDFAVRVFAPFYGVPEDPATGSSNGCLAGYLARHEYTGSDTVSARVEQGYEMGRPSLVQLRASGRGEAVTVEVGGGVVPVARGQLL